MRKEQKEAIELIDFIEPGENSSQDLEDANKVLELTDAEIQESLNLQNPGIKKVGRKKLPINIMADELVSKFFTDKSDENWKNLQEFFWYGIFDYAKKLLNNNVTDAYDMTIQTFINAYYKCDTYDPNKGKFSTWLWSICKNCCYGFSRNINDHLNIITDDIADIYDSEMFKGGFYMQNHSEFENGVFNGNEFSSQNMAEVTKSLYDVSIDEMNKISGISGQILHMKLVDGKKIREIAKELSMNESTVKNYLYRGKENLRRILSINHRDLVDMYVDMNDANEKYNMSL